MEKSNNGRRIKHSNILIIEAVCVFTACFVALCCEDDRYALLWLLPIAYLVCIAIVRFRVSDSSFLISTFIIVCGIKYVVSPVLIVLSGYYMGYGSEPSRDSISFAIVLSAYELLFLSVVLSCAYSKSSTKYKIISDTRKVKKAHIDSYVVALILLIGFLLAFDRQALVPKSLFELTQSNGLAAEGISASSLKTLSSIVSFCFKMFVPIVLLRAIERAGVSENKKIALSFLVYFLTISLFFSTHRWNLLVVTVVFATMLANTYRLQRYRIYAVYGAFGCVILLVVTAVKFMGSSVFSNDVFETARAVLKLLSESTQEYFSGPRNIAQAIDMKNAFGINYRIDYFFNDLLGSTPVFSSFFDQSLRYNTLYNAYIYPNSGIICQIIPMSGIGLCSFGALLSPLPLCMVYLIGTHFDKKLSQYSDVANQYVYRTIVVYTCFSVGLDLQIITNKYFAAYIPVLLLIWACQRFEKRGSERENNYSANS